MKTKPCPCPQCSKQAPYTKEQVREHVNDCGFACPNCGSSLIKVSSASKRFPTYVVPMYCTVCKHKWFDVYKLVGLEPRE